MKLVAEILTGTLFYVEVGEDATIGDLKKHIGNQENLPRDRLILMLDSDERNLLDKDEVQLKDYGVQDGSHIYIFFQPRDDGSSASPSPPKESASSEPSPSMDISNEPPKEDNDNETENEANEDEPSNDNVPPKEDNENETGNEANEPSPSVDPISAQSEE